MRYFGKILFLLVICLLFIPSVYANDDKNLVNIYMFYSESCPHCTAERELFDELSDKYDNIRIYKYEISNDDNSKLYEELASLYDTSATGVPCTFIGEKVYKGFSYENSKKKFMAVINFYSQYGYKDIAGEYIGGIELPSYDIDESVNMDEYLSNYGSNIISFLGFNIETKDLALPVVSILIGLVDGFNPCAMWVLLFLISMLIGMKNKKRMWILGITFLLTSAFIYLIFMLAWLNVASLISSISFVRLTIGLIAIGGSILNLYGYFKTRKTEGCSVVNDNKRKKIFGRIKKFTQEKNLFLAMVGVMALAISVNVIELACSAGLPAMFIEILSVNDLSVVQEFVYIALYMLFFLMDDLIVFFIAMRTMQLTGFSTKYGKLSKLIGGILLFLIGILLIFKPEWLMFNF